MWCIFDNPDPIFTLQLVSLRKSCINTKNTSPEPHLPIALFDSKTIMGAGLPKFDSGKIAVQKHQARNLFRCNALVRIHTRPEKSATQPMTSTEISLNL